MYNSVCRCILPLRWLRSSYAYPLSIIGFWLIFGLSACKIDRFLRKDDYVIKTNKLVLTGVKDSKKRGLLKTQLATLYKQKDLPSFFGGKSRQGTWYYLRGQQDKDTTNWEKLQYKLFAQKRVTLYDPLLTRQTEQNMRQFLKNSGYLYPQVSSTTDTKQKDKGLIDVTYFVDPGRQYIIDSIIYECESDSTLQFLVQDLAKDNAFLKKGVPLDLQLYEQEKQRITTGLNNLGYALFTYNFIAPLEADTNEVRYDALGNRLINVVFKVLKPNDRPQHPVYKVGDVYVYQNFDAVRGESDYDSITVRGRKLFLLRGPQSPVKIDLLDRAIQLTPGDTFRRSSSERTIRQITNLGVYRVSVKPQLDTCISNDISYKIFLTPYERLGFEAGVELNYANISSISSGSFGRVGAALDMGYVNKNLFRGAERFASNLYLGFDYGLSRTLKQNNVSWDIRFNNSISVPKLVQIDPVMPLFAKLKLINRDFYKRFRENANSDIAGSYSFTDRLALDLYRLQQLNLGFRYILADKNNAERYIINPIGVELNLGRLSPNFRVNERVTRSFETQLMTGLLFRSLSYEKNWSRADLFADSWKLTSSIEQSGTEIWLLGRLVNRGQSLRLDGLKFSKYGRFEANMNFTRRFSEKKAFAMRLGLGVAAPFGDATTVPYSRQFFVGGPNSIRGWRAYALGQGGYQNRTETAIPYQAGDLKFEFNSEFRFPLFWLFQSALFFDGGNIWNLKPDIDAPESDFGKFWYKQIALSTGVGLRIDVEYALIRFDFGFRLRNPYTDAKGNRWIDPSQYSVRNNLNTNIALGLPF